MSVTYTQSGPYFATIIKPAYNSFHSFQVVFALQAVVLAIFSPWSSLSPALHMVVVVAMRTSLTDLLLQVVTY